MRPSQLIVFLFISTLIIGCNKKTKSEFVLYTYEYVAGESLDFTNLKPSKKQIWTITNDDNEILTTYEGKHPQMVTSLLWSDGLYSLNLFDNIKEQEKDIEAKQKSFLIKCNRTALEINYLGTENKPYWVLIDGEDMGNTQTSSIGTLNIPQGLRHIRILSKPEWSSTAIE